MFINILDVNDVPTLYSVQHNFDLEHNSNLLFTTKLSSLKDLISAALLASLKVLQLEHQVNISIPLKNMITTQVLFKHTFLFHNSSF